MNECTRLWVNLSCLGLVLRLSFMPAAFYVNMSNCFKQLCNCIHVGKPCYIKSWHNFQNSTGYWSLITDYYLEYKFHSSSESGHGEINCSCRKAPAADYDVASYLSSICLWFWLCTSTAEEEQVSEEDQVSAKQGGGCCYRDMCPWWCWLFWHWHWGIRCHLNAWGNKCQCSSCSCDWFANWPICGQMC